MAAERDPYGLSGIDSDSADEPNARARVFVLYYLAMFATVGAALVVGGAAIIGVVAAPLGLAVLWSRVSVSLQGAGWRFAALAVLLATGFTFYIIRRDMRRTYAVIELAVGMMLCNATLGKLDQNRLTVALGLLGGIYVIVRGLDNFNTGTKKARAS